MILKKSKWIEHFSLVVNTCLLYMFCKHGGRYNGIARSRIELSDSHQTSRINKDKWSRQKVGGRTVIRLSFIYYDCIQNKCCARHSLLTFILHTIAINELQHTQTGQVLGHHDTMACKPNYLMAGLFTFNKSNRYYIHKILYIS